MMRSVISPAYRPFVFRQPDYFSWKSLLPSQWFPDHTWLGKMYNILDPFGNNMDKQKLEEQLKTSEEVIRQYSDVILDSEKKLATAVSSAKNIQQQATSQLKQISTDEQNKNVILVFAIVLLLGVGSLFIFKSKKP